MAPPTITSATNLPGAILFLTVFHSDDVVAKTGKSNTLVAYDPEMKDKDTFTACIKRWKDNGLPYRERFTDPIAGVENAASFSATDFYSGIFGINANRTSLSQPWPYKDGGVVQNGIDISFWNQTATQKGLFTSAAGQRFNSSSKTAIMALNPGNQKELLTGGIAVDHVKSIKLEFYAMGNNGKIDFTK